MYAIEDGAAIHFKNENSYKNLSFIEGAKVFMVEENDGIIKEKAQQMNSLL